MPDALDPVPLLRALHERGIEHIVVGGEPQQWQVELRG